MLNKTISLTKSIFAGLLYLLLIASCVSDPQLPYGDRSLITGHATPIALQPDTTTIVLEDYFDDISEIEEILPTPGIEIVTSEQDGEIQLIASQDVSGLSLLKVRSKSRHTYDILLKKSTRKQINYTFDPKGKTYKTVNIVGDMNAWNAASSPLNPENGLWTINLSLEPGTYAFQLELDGERHLDPAAPTRDNGMGGFNSLLSVEGPTGVSPYIVVASTEGKSITLSNQGRQGQITIFWENSCLMDTIIDREITFNIPKEAASMSRSHIRAYVYNDEGGIGNDVFIPLAEQSVIQSADQLSRHDLHQQIMYFLMVDRFYNGNPDNDRPESDPSIHPLANFKGGDLEGIIHQLDQGYFDQLGINTLWLSPIPRNPEGAYGLWDDGGVTSTFSAYHGYWPTGLTDVDERFGTKEELKILIDRLHSSDKNILLDFVAHHIHEEHPLYEEKKDEDWFTNLYLEDGSLNTERWDDHRLTTWFDVFLPTFNFFNPDVNEALSDTAMYWIENYGIDGFRHDATKHIHLDFWRTLTKKVKAFDRQSGLKTYQVGETYGTPELIASYISTGLLDAQFDFNLFDAAIAAFCKTNEPFSHLKSTIGQSLRYYGYNHLMGHMSGNQDRARFMAYATGDIRFDEDAKYAGWTRDIELRNSEGFSKLAQMHAFNMTMPGVPCIYYGDEIGMTGGNDPDNRRMMYFEDWNEEESHLFEQVQSLIKLRKQNLAMMYGDLKIIDHDDDNVLIYSRQYLDHTAIIFFNNSNVDKTISTPLEQPVHWTSVFSGQEVDSSNSALTVKVKAHSYGILYHIP